MNKIYPFIHGNRSSCNNDKDPEFGNDEDDFFSETKDKQKEVIKMLVTGIKGIWKKFENTSWHVPNEEISALRSQMAGLLFLLKSTAHLDLSKHKCMLSGTIL